MSDAALPVHAWIYGFHKQNATPEEYYRLASSRIDGQGTNSVPGQESWRMACGAVFCGPEGNYRVFGPRRLQVVWPLRRHFVTCEECLATVDALMRPESAYVAQLRVQVEAEDAAERAHTEALIASKQEEIRRERRRLHFTGKMLKCPECGESFEQRARSGACHLQVYCRTRCKTRAYRRRVRKAARVAERRRSA